MDFLVMLAEQAFKFIVEPVKEQFSHVLFYGTHIKELGDKANDLSNKLQDMQGMVAAARNNNRLIKKGVEDWMDQVEAITKEANPLSSLRSCTNLRLRHQRSRNAKEMTKTINELIRQRGSADFDRVSIPMLPPSIWPSSVDKESFKSRNSTMNQIMEALRDPTVRMMGLYGLGGVGKTTLAQQVAKKAQEDKLFKMVVWVEVKHKSLKEIQSQIAYKVGLSFDMQSESEIVTASRLHQRLEQEKSLLLVLDDLWRRLDLDEVGIPRVDKGNEHYKIILTSRSEDMLSSQMNCKRNIKVELLSKEEACELFKKMAEINDDLDDPDLLSIATEVSQKCAQLPVALVTVARALRNNKSISKWSDALLQLQRHTSQNILGVKDQVYSSIKLSYDYLESQELKSTFLLSATVSQEPSMLDILMYSVGLDFLEGICCMKEARARLDTLVYQLKASSLLLDNNENDCFSIHDVVHDVALCIASVEQHALIWRHKKVDEWPDKHQLESCTAICLDESDIDELPGKLYGLKVEFFLLNSKNPQLGIPCSFFEEMKELKVLNLTNMVFSQLPPSISHLKKLKTLSLQYCTLENITAIADLKKLKILNLSYSTIKSLPREVGQLSCLQMLNLNGCYELEVIPPNILSNLKKLEDLYMECSFNGWGDEGSNDGKERASLEELNHLPQLSTLRIDFPDASDLPKNLFLENSLERYRISIGSYWWQDQSGNETSKSLTLKNNHNLRMEYGVFRLLENVEDLYLENLNGITHLCQGQVRAQPFCKLRRIKVRYCDHLKFLFSISMVRTFCRLEKIKVSECKSMEKIVALEDEENANKENVIKFLRLRSLTLNFLPVLADSCLSNMAFPKLEKLKLSGKQAGMTWNGRFQKDQFPSVKHLYLGGIYDKAATFSDDLFDGFPNLQQLDVSLSYLEAIFSSSGPPHHDTQKRAQFTNLKLSFLDQLKRIWKTEKCPINLTYLDVSNCDGLINLLTSSIARLLVQLRRLSIKGCKNMEEIITYEEGGKEDIVSMNLKILEFHQLSSCKSFCSYKHTFEFPLLDEVIIIGCPRFKMFCSGSLTTPLLEGVKVENNEMRWKDNLNQTIKQLFSEKVAVRDADTKIHEYPELTDLSNMKLTVPSCSFSYLTSLVLKKCGLQSNDHAVPSYVLTTLINLTSLEVSYCDSVEVIFDLEGIDIDKEALLLQAIPLGDLKLDHLPKLKHVWNKDPHIFCFQHLHYMHAHECESLSSVFPASIAKGFDKLENLDIESCGVEVIVAEDQIHGPTIDFVFPQLQFLRLINLPKLKNFSSQSHTIEWPKLSHASMDVRECPLKISTPFSSKRSVGTLQRLRGIDAVHC